MDPAHPSLLDAEAPLLATLDRALEAHAARFPGDRPERQPVHTVYGGAHLYRADSARKLGALALASMDAHAPDPFAFAAALGLPGHATLPEAPAERDALLARFAVEPDALERADRARWLPLAVHARVREKLAREPVEDQRIDFEDGFGVRADAEEDAEALRAAGELAAAVKAGLAPPFVGVRIKALEGALARRAVRTLDRFVQALVDALGGLPPGFVVTLPKVVIPEQVATLAALLGRLELRHGLASGAIGMELMIELPQALLGADGVHMLPRLRDAAGGRCRGAHFGSYDYTAACDVSAAFQSMQHAACRFALQQMKVAFAGTGVFLSDGATTELPIGPHRAAPGATLDEAAREANRAVVHRAWRRMHENVRASLVDGFYQGWDLHPAQLPVRYAATYAFFLETLPEATERLARFVARAAQASRVGEAFDDAGRGQGLLNVFVRGLASGALRRDEVLRTGLTPEAVRTRSFVAIVGDRG